MKKKKDVVSPVKLALYNVFIALLKVLCNEIPISEWSLSEADLICLSLNNEECYPE